MALARRPGPPSSSTRALSWDDVEWIKERWGGKLILKGILDPEDARLAADSGADALDRLQPRRPPARRRAARRSRRCRRSSTAVGDRIEVLDGRRHPLRPGRAQGAWRSAPRARYIGRAFLYGLGAMGEAGVTRALEIIRKELDLTMAFCGRTRHPRRRRRHPRHRPRPLIPLRISSWHETLSGRARGPANRRGEKITQPANAGFLRREAAKVAVRRAPGEREPSWLPEAGASPGAAQERRPSPLPFAARAPFMGKNKQPGGRSADGPACRTSRSIVTGASRGIGAAAAEAMAAEGAALLLLARSAEGITALATRLRKGGAQAEAMTCDVAEFSQVQAAVARAREAFGRIDALINNAGVIEPIGPLARADPARLGARRRHQLQGRLPRHARGAAGDAGAGLRASSSTSARARPTTRSRAGATIAPPRPRPRC